MSNVAKCSHILLDLRKLLNCEKKIMSRMILASLKIQSWLAEINYHAKKKFVFLLLQPVLVRLKQIWTGLMIQSSLGEHETTYLTTSLQLQFVLQKWISRNAPKIRITCLLAERKEIAQNYYRLPLNILFIILGSKQGTPLDLS